MLVNSLFAVLLIKQQHSVTVFCTEVMEEAREPGSHRAEITFKSSESFVLHTKCDVETDVGIYRVLITRHHHLKTNMAFGILAVNSICIHTGDTLNDFLLFAFLSFDRLFLFGHAFLLFRFLFDPTAIPTLSQQVT